jgi:hypothetical protein
MDTKIDMMERECKNYNILSTSKQDHGEKTSGRISYRGTRQAPLFYQFLCCLIVCREIIYFNPQFTSLLTLRVQILLLQGISSSFLNFSLSYFLFHLADQVNGQICP